MCGIYASVSKTGSTHPSPGLKQLLCQRGPDHLGELDVHIGSDSGTVSLSFVSTVLALRGGHIAVQPLVDSQTGSILCWNGEAWKIGDEPVEGNDGEAVLALLASRTSSLSTFDSMNCVLGALQRLSGPFAFVYFDKVHQLLYFGRDCLGRRSLLLNATGMDTTIQFSSIAGTTGGPWRELEADGIYVIAVSSVLAHPSLIPLPIEHSQSGSFLLHRTSGYVDLCHEHSKTISKMNLALPLEPYHLDSYSSSVNQLEAQLHESLKLRVLNIPNPPNSQFMNEAKLAILFSGGLDCTVLARMAHALLPAKDPIDLLNVAFENPRVVQAAQSRTNGKDTAEVTNAESAYELCPDRITGRKALRELRQVCPERIWRFIEVNIPYVVVMTHRDKVVPLMYPHNTEMDLSIAFALYFASRGSGLASAEQGAEPVNYTTPARVLLSGLGADELFGGYTRHATAFERKSFPGLLSELKLDIDRLGKRNLGRDDRVIANWGREARYPYLDESLVNWALETPVWSKCGFGTVRRNGQEAEDDLEPGKKVLRLLARKLGLMSVATEKKRAANSVWGEDGKDGDRQDKRDISYFVRMSLFALDGGDDSSDTAELQMRLLEVGPLALRVFLLLQ